MWGGVGGRGYSPFLCLLFQRHQEANDPGPEKLFLLTLLSIFKVFYGSSSAGPTCSSFSCLVQQANQTHTSTLAASLFVVLFFFFPPALIKLLCLESAFHPESKLHCESLSSRSRRRGNMAALEMIYKKNIVHPCCYLFRNQEKGDMKQWTELCVLGLAPDKDRASDQLPVFADRRRRVKSGSAPLR